MVRVIEVGWKARALVDHATVRASVVAALSRSLYLEVGGELVWLGGPGSTLHARAIVAAALPDLAGGTTIDVSFDLGWARVWRAVEIPARVPREILAPEGARLVAALDRIGEPDGFGALLAGRRPAFPLDRAADLGREFLRACASGDAPSAAALGERLLGLGPGLTPAGDDLVGGAMFGWSASAEPARRNAAATIRAAATARTHRISADLLGDLLDGDGYAPLHDLAQALASREPAAALDAARRLVRIGHSSGWDILTGVLGALGLLESKSMA